MDAADDRGEGRELQALACTGAGARTVSQLVLARITDREGQSGPIRCHACWYGFRVRRPHIRPHKRSDTCHKEL